MPASGALRFYFLIYLEVGICVLELRFYNMTKVGLTGGIGSGKTTVAKIFEMLGVAVYYADEAARRIMNEDEELRKSIQNQFGAAVYKNGELDRDYLASKVFREPRQLELLNALVHPATIRDAVAWMEQQRTAYTIKEAALIFESAAAEQLACNGPTLYVSITVFSRSCS